MESYAAAGIVAALILVAAVVYLKCFRASDDDGMEREGGQRTKIRHEGGI